jgi:hypothetical protein
MKMVAPLCVDTLSSSVSASRSGQSFRQIRGASVCGLGLGTGQPTVPPSSGLGWLALV